MEHETDTPGEEWRRVEVPFGEPGHAGKGSDLALAALVLQARYIPCRVEEDEGRETLAVPALKGAQAERELRLFEEENRNWPPPQPEASRFDGNVLVVLCVLLLLATFHNITSLDSLPGVPLPDWVPVAGGDAARIREGEWWRVVTALMLHADIAHLAGNLVIGGIFVVSLSRETGSSLAWGLVLLSGGAGNLLNAVLRTGSHTSIGASTAVFGALGLLACIRVAREQRPFRRYLPFAAAVSLLAILGTEGERTDLGAHIFGFLSGFTLGVPAIFLAGKGWGAGWRGRVVAVLSAAVVGVAWWCAVHR